MRRYTEGFTIVELLIVIVVIGILAAITIVAYNGIRQRAVTTAYTSAVDSWGKILQMEDTTNEPLQTNFSCLGTSAADFPQTTEFEAGQCVKIVGAPSDAGYYYEETFFQGWTNERQNGLLPVSTVTFPGDDSAIKSRGVFGVRTLAEHSPTGKPGSAVIWYPQVAGECGRGKSLDIDAAIPNGSLSGGVCSLDMRQ